MLASIEENVAYSSVSQCLQVIASFKLLQDCFSSQYVMSLCVSKVCAPDGLFSFGTAMVLL